MHNSSAHIISKLQWHTSFDRRENAFQLQERISSWTKNVLDRELSSALNSLCPFDQIWRMTSVELDLGEIVYEEMESQLSQRTVARLKEKLVEMLLYPNHDNHRIEVVNTGISQLDLLQEFLLTGIISWSYSSKYGSVNSMLRAQLQNNNHEIIHVIRELGKAKESVRKRLAWQFDDKNIRRIIKGLEPYNHMQIFSFTRDITNIQARENIVQSSGIEFRQNLWFWVLNHILVERGSVFNKISFVKSSIYQMASHYNISFFRLLGLIKSALTKLAPGYHKNDLINVLSILTSNLEEQSPVYAYNHEENLTLFENYLSEGWADANKLRKNDFKNVFAGLVKDVPQRVYDIMDLSFKSNGNYFFNRVGNEEIIHIVSTIFNGTGAQICRDTQIIQRLLKSQNLSVKKEMLWQLMFQYVTETALKNYQVERYTDYVCENLYKRLALSKPELLLRLTFDNETQERNVFALSIRNHLLESFSYDERMPLDEFLKKFSKEKRSGQPEWRLLKHMLESMSRIDASKLLQTLKSRASKTTLREIIPLLLDEMVWSKLMAVFPESYKAVLFHTGRRIEEWGIKNQFSDRDIQCARYLMCQWMLHATLVLNKTREADLMEYVMRQCHLGFSDDFQLYHEKINAPDGNGIRVDENQRKYSLKSGDFLHGHTSFKINRLLGSAGVNKIFCSKVLRANFQTHDFIRIRKSGKREADEIINYFIRDIEGLKKILMERFAVLTGREMLWDAFYEMLEDSFWHHVIAYESHQGDWRRLIGNYGTHFLKTDVEIYAGAESKKTTQHRNSEGKGEGNGIPVAVSWSVMEDLFWNETKWIALKNEYAAEIQKAISQKPELLFNILRRNGFSKKHFDRLVEILTPAGFIQAIRKPIGLQGKRIIERLFLFRSKIRTTRYTEELSGLYYGLFKIGMSSLNESRIPSQSELMEYMSEENGLTGGFSFLESDGSEDHTQTAMECMEQLFPLKEVSVTGSKEENELSREILSWERKGELMGVCSMMLVEGNAVDSSGLNQKYSRKQLLETIAEIFPEVFLKSIEGNKLSEFQIRILIADCSFDFFLQGLKKYYKNRLPEWERLRQFYFSFENLDFRGFTSKDIQDIIYRKTILAMMNGNWRNMQAVFLWNEILWDLSRKKTLSLEKMMMELDKVKFAFPPAFQVGYDSIPRKGNQSPVNGNVSSVLKKTDAPELIKVKKAEELPTILVKNAGLILMSNYIQMLFERLEIVKEGRFISEKAQRKAVHCLQYVATGLQKSEEGLLVLNKIICGLLPADPVENEMEWNEKEVLLIEGLVNAMIGYWPAIGKTSIQGFRGNWFVRDGVLIECEDKWELTVEKRAYDVLIHQSPFSFSIIKYAWMQKPLYVTWPY